MGPSATPRFDIFEIYAKYCDIVSRNQQGSSKDSLAILSKSFECRGQTRDTIFNDICDLMSCLDLSVDSRHFNCFYEFVFFICRENGQKNIPVHRAITAWRLVLSGRFRLLNQWCSFVEKHQRHNVSEDTWQQLLAFSRCVNEDLEGYDPKEHPKKDLGALDILPGAWPVLIDDFVEHMYSINQSSCCSDQDNFCGCGDMDMQPSISNTFSGLNLLPGSKRKFPSGKNERNEETTKPSQNSMSSVHLMKYKRFKQTSVATKLGHYESDLSMSLVDGTTDYLADSNKHNSFGCLQSACAVEDCLSKGFEGFLSIGCCFQFDQKSRVSYTN